MNEKDLSLPRPFTGDISCCAPGTSQSLLAAVSCHSRSEGDDFFLSILRGDGMRSSGIVIKSLHWNSGHVLSLLCVHKTLYGEG